MAAAPSAGRQLLRVQDGRQRHRVEALDQTSHGLYVQAAFTQRLPLALRTLDLYFYKLDDDASPLPHLPQQCHNNSRLVRTPFGWGCRNGAYIAEAAAISVGLGHGDHTRR